MSRRAIYAVVVAGGFGLGIIGALLAFREPTEPLTAALLRAAEDRWAAASVDSYTLRYKMLNRAYEVEVHQGIVHSVRVDGTPARTSDAAMYGVEGLFRTLQMDLDNATDPSGPFSNVMMRARFHPVLGYLEHYVRSSGGHGRGASIVDVRLEPR